ncbi:heterokaryon incompatibility protein-domain-containing protein [Pyrenochaeta sp. MPI-SDFR-AT-0127]|nr:heterokaryon incompatibility protein-domain-containing protein [Pyrenochaeta sp. MPI-SDFR-AT-0127]
MPSQWTIIIPATPSSGPTTRTLNSLSEAFAASKLSDEEAAKAGLPPAQPFVPEEPNNDYSPELTELCHLCNGMNIEDLISGSGYKHVATFEDLMLPDHKSCPFCRDIRESTDHGTAEEERALRTPGEAIVLKLVPAQVPKMSEIQFFNANWPKSFGGWKVLCYEDDPAAAFGVSTTHKVDYIGSSSSMQTAREWLAHCQQQHDCGEKFPFLKDLVDDYPSRLLKIYEFSSVIVAVKLVQLNEKPRDPYAALSYCWGKPVEDRISLKTANKSKFETAIPIDTIPKTIREAITICTNLGIRYIWVDSFCIIQDSKEDWLKESKKMGGIYAGSAITIAADAAMDSLFGCFNQKSKSQIEGMKSLYYITTTTKSGKNSTLMVGGLSSISNNIAAIENSPLTTRGWTYQERLLPPRILHCTKDQLYWECRNGFQSEDDLIRWEEKRLRTKPSFVKNLADFDTSSGRWKESVLANPSTASDKSFAARLALGFWYAEVVSGNYCHRTLTYGSDKLPAISGIAKALSNSWEGQYVCGMWNLMLPEALLWTRRIGDNEPSLPPHNASYRCPSWSWAAYDFPVDWINGVAQSDATNAIRIMNITVAPVLGGDPYGQVRDASLQVFGMTTVLTLQERPDLMFPLSNWLMNEYNQPIGMCNLDFKYPNLRSVYVLLCVVRNTPRGHAGGVLCLRKSNKGFEMFERVGSGVVGFNVPGTFQMAGIKEASARFLQDLAMKKPQFMTLV